MITTSTARRTAAAILAGDAALVALYVGYTQTASFHWFVHLLFNLNGEANIPAWYTSAQLLLAGTLFVLVAISRTEDRVGALLVDGAQRRRQRGLPENVAFPVSGPVRPEEVAA